MNPPPAPLDETHDPQIRSWVETANALDCDFTLQNLPFGIFRRHGRDEPFRVGVAIGDAILDLSHPAAAGLIAPPAAAACRSPALNDLMALGPQAWRPIRVALSRALRAGHPAARSLQGALVAQAQSEYSMPARIGDFTDFYSSIHHATAVGRLLRPDQPLLPNYKWLPVAYHGRASSIDVSGVPIFRPRGQLGPGAADAPNVAPTRRLDYELELGVLIGQGNAPGKPIPVGSAWEHVFGVVLLNDWSARDIQAWEYQPLGPFLSKNFATRISPWVVTAQALAPFRRPLRRPDGDPAPLPYLYDASDAMSGALDVRLEAAIRTPAMRARGEGAFRLSRCNASDAYWTVAQLLAHHTVNGCNLRAGDLVGTGTLSGPQPGQGGCLLELTQGGREPVQLPAGEARGFLEDGDEVVLTGACERDGYSRIGLGCVRSLVVAASGC
jgi:fumarylacetoacetase